MMFETAYDDVVHAASTIHPNANALRMLYEALCDFHTSLVRILGWQFVWFCVVMEAVLQVFPPIHKASATLTHHMIFVRIASKCQSAQSKTSGQTPCVSSAQSVLCRHHIMVLPGWGCFASTREHFESPVHSLQSHWTTVLTCSCAQL